MRRWVEHTSELELELEAGSVAATLGEAVAAISELLDPDRRADAAAAESVELTAAGRDPETLLAAWVEELVYLAESRALIPLSIEAVAVDEQRPRSACARVLAGGGEPRPLVKAVTYHRLLLERADGGWRGRVVLDV